MVFARAVHSVHCPHDNAEVAHFVGCRNAYFVGAAKHPRQYSHAVGEYDYALRAHLPKRVRQLFFVKLVHIVHGERMGRVAVHDDAVFGVLRKPRHVAHHVRGKLGRRSAAVGKAPQKLYALFILRDAHDAEVVFGVVLDVF